MMVLIVAKCIVNAAFNLLKVVKIVVLIVAKCIVNFSKTGFWYSISESINSSKVYCKLATLDTFPNFVISINSSKVYCK